jgi:hypothetical protein
MNLAAGPNLSAYVGNSPVAHIDPLGLQLYVPGPPPIGIVPRRCSAGPWQLVDHGADSRFRTKWALTRTWNVSLMAPQKAEKGMGSTAFLGACFCEWTKAGTMKVTRLWELWKRTITCCDGAHDQYGTQSREVKQQVPSIGRVGVKAITSGSSWGGRCNCSEPF